ncbi:unnamed protein product [Nezara viridula]|uniref:Major facilitator superfamily (MFS) profile domain-containing protein n=1 Tax=Nezara viridula TaxID=85310 RepID=A0A9P0H0P2_NEZVI|nr:unnamed protein product [Nezara viridula]
MMEISPELVPNPDAVSWISAVPPLGALCGSLAAGPLMQNLGRKGALLIAAPLFALAWAAVAFSPTTAYLVTARAACGFCVGLILPSAQVYVSECSHPRIRGRLGTLPAIFMAAGILVAYLLGYFFTWYRLALVSAAFPTALLLLLIPLPESPAWLRSRGKNKAADAAMDWLHLQPTAPQIELFTVTEVPKPPALPTPKENNIKHSKTKLRGPYSPSELFKKSVLVPFGIVLAILVFQQISGIDTIIFYTVSIFQASGSDIGEYEATIVVGVVQLLATIFSIFIIDRFGRKPLLMWSGVIMVVSMIALGYYFYLHERGRAFGLGSLPLISQMLFIAGFSVGFSNVPFILMGELLPSAQRSLLSSVSGAANLGSMFVVIKTYPDTVTVIGSEGAFWMYAGCSFVGCIFVYFLLPETKGKTLEEIEAIFEPKKPTRKEAEAEAAS